MSIVLERVHYFNAITVPIVNALEYVKKQPAAFQAEYAKTYAYDNGHAYERSNPFSCPGGMVERIILTLRDLATQFKTDPDMSEEKLAEYETLYLILENYKVEDAVRNYGGECSDEDPIKFRDCIREKARDRMKGRYPGNNSVNTYLTSIGMLSPPVVAAAEGGGHRRKTRRARKTRGTRKNRKNRRSRTARAFRFKKTLSRKNPRRTT
jgi:hypothetical protein